MTHGKLAERTDVFDVAPIRDGLVEVTHFRVTRPRNSHRCAECGALANYLNKLTDLAGNPANICNVCRRKLLAKPATA